MDRLEITLSHGLSSVDLFKCPLAQGSCLALPAAWTCHKKQVVGNAQPAMGEKLPQKSASDGHHCVCV